MLVERVPKLFRKFTLSSYSRSRRHIYAKIEDLGICREFCRDPATMLSKTPLETPVTSSEFLTAYPMLIRPYNLRKWVSTGSLSHRLCGSSILVAWKVEITGTPALCDIQTGKPL